MALDFVRRHPWWIWFALVLFFTSILVLVFIPRGIRWSLERWLENQGRISAEIEDVDFNPFTGRMAIHTLLAQREGGPGRIRTDRATLNLRWWPLAQRRILLESLTVQDATVTVRREEDSWYVGGLKILARQDQATEKSNWDFGLGEIDLRKVKVLYLDGEVRREIFIEEAHLDSMQAWNPDESGAFQIHMEAGGAPLTLSGKARPFASQPSAEGRLEVSGFPLPWIQPWIGSSESEVGGGRLSAALDFDIRLRPEEERLGVAANGSISLEDLQGRIQGTHIEQADLAWGGTLELAVPREGEPPLVTVEGTLSSDGIQAFFRQPSLRVTLGTFSFREDFALGTAEAPAGADFLLLLEGSAGPLQVVDLQTKRTLAALAQLTVLGMRLAGREEIAAEALQASDLRLLERPEGADVGPAHYLELERLGVEEIEGALTGKVEIGSLRLAGVEGVVVRDEEGRVALDPWSFGDEGKGSARSAEKDGERDGNGTGIPEWQIAQIQVEGENRLIFVDRSVEPAVRVALSPFEATVRDLDTSAEAQDPPVRFSLRLRAEGHPLALEGSVRPFGEKITAEAQLSMEGWPLELAGPYLGPEVRVTGGTLGADGRIGIAYGQQARDLTASFGGSLALTDLRGSMAQAEIRQGAATWKGRASVTVEQEAEKGPPRVEARGTLEVPQVEAVLTTVPMKVAGEKIQVEGEFAMGTPGVPEGSPFLLSVSGNTGGVLAVDPERDLEIFAAQGLRLEQVRLTGPSDLSAGTVLLQAPRALERPGPGSGEEPSHLVSADTLGLAGLRLAGPADLQVSEMRLTALVGALVRDEEGRFDLGAWTGGGDEEEPPEKEVEKKGGEKEELRMKADLLLVEGESRLLFRDLSVDPAVTLELSPLEVRVENLDTSPGSRSPIRIEGRFGRYAPLSIQGTATAFTAAPTMDIETELEGFSLPKVTGYIEKYVGYTVKSGEMGLRLEAKVEKGQMQGEARLVLTRLNLEALSSQERKETEQELGFPLNTGLSLLRDKQGTITLTIPLSGDIQSPQVGIAAVVRQAVVKAMREAAVGYFANLGATALGAPAGAAFLAKRFIFDRLTAVRFRPVFFPPGMTVLTQGAGNYLREMAQKLEDRPEINIVLCGVAVPSDAQALPPSAGEETLLQLARMRADAVKDALVEMGIAPGRLIQCTPEFLEEEGEGPRVEIGI